MAVFDDKVLQGVSTNIEVIRPVGRRRITHVFHDIDGTHSLIRQWQPVMSLSIHWAMTCGLRDDFDSPANLAALIERVGRDPLPETDQFCIESAGLSALTQMEYGIRRAVELGNVPADAGFALSEQEKKNNSEIVRRIWNGQERFPDIHEPAGLLAFIQSRTPRLFRLYEAILNGACRDRNTADARVNPQNWLVPGAMEFMDYLHRIGCLNFFVTGAVIYADGGMFEEVTALGFQIGPGKMVESMVGSSWDRKVPKEEVMRELCQTLGVDPANAMVVGDGRTEIKAGADMGCVTISRLDSHAARQRQLHIELGTQYILPDYSDPILRQLFRQE